MTKFNGICIGGPQEGQRISSSYSTVESYKKGSRLDIFDDEITLQLIAKTVYYKFVQMDNAENLWLLKKDYENLLKAKHKEAFIHNLLVNAYRQKCND